MVLVPALLVTAHLSSRLGNKAGANVPGANGSLNEPLSGPWHFASHVFRPGVVIATAHESAPRQGSGPFAVSGGRKTPPALGNPRKRGWVLHTGFSVSIWPGSAPLPFDALHPVSFHDILLPSSPHFSSSPLLLSSPPSGPSLPLSSSSLSHEELIH